jgi:hypothetical protein
MLGLVSLRLVLGFLSLGLSTILPKDGFEGPVDISIDHPYGSGRTVLLLTPGGWRPETLAAAKPLVEGWRQEHKERKKEKIKEQRRLDRSPTAVPVHQPAALDI